MVKLERRIRDKVEFIEKDEILEKLCKSIFSKYYAVKVGLLKNKKTKGRDIQYILNISKGKSYFQTLEYLAVGNPNTTGDTLDSIGRFSESELAQERVAENSNVYDKTLYQMLCESPYRYINPGSSIWIVVNAYNNPNASDKTKRKATEILKELNMKYLIKNIS